MRKLYRGSGLTCYLAVAGFQGTEAAISKIPSMLNQTQKLSTSPAIGSKKLLTVFIRLQ